MTTKRRSGGPSNDPGSRFVPLEVGPPTPDALCVEASLSALVDPVTPTDRFFIRSHFAVPRLERESWRLTVDGQVRRPVEIDFAELAQLPHREIVSTMECAGNSRSTVRPRPEGVLWGHGAVSTGRWRGVPLRLLLERAGVRTKAREVVLGGADRGTEAGHERELAYEMSIDLPTALDPDTLLVDEMNGAPLSPSHGFPVRAIVPGQYGMASVKWLTRVTVLDRPFEGYFRSRAYVYIREGQRAGEPTPPATRMRVKSLINWPREGQVLTSGRHRVRGIAWSGEAPIARVEVNVSPPSASADVWRTARLHSAPSRYSWSHWELRCDLPDPGFYVLRVRATDELGNGQPIQAEWNFKGLGNNSIHCVPVEVRPGSGTDAPP